MGTVTETMFVRTDIWREGAWLDLWSVVHFLSGISVGLTFYFLHFGALASTALALVSLTAYEMWEALVHIEEATTNRVMDVVVGMISFLPTFFLLAPRLTDSAFLTTFGAVLSANIVMSAFGWHASQKAAVLQKRVHERFALERKKLLHRSKKSKRGEA